MRRYRKGAKVKSIVGHFTKRRLSWYGHIRQRDPEDINATVLDRDIRGKIPVGRHLHQMDEQYMERYENI